MVSYDWPPGTYFYFCTYIALFWIVSLSVITSLTKLPPTTNFLHVLSHQSSSIFLDDQTIAIFDSLNILLWYSLLVWHCTSTNHRCIILPNFDHTLLFNSPGCPLWSITLGQKTTTTTTTKRHSCFWKCGWLEKPSPGWPQLYFFNHFSADILFRSLVSFAFLYCSYFLIVCLFFEMKNIRLIHIQLCRWVSDKKLFSSGQFPEIRLLFLALLHMLNAIFFLGK